MKTEQQIFDTLERFIESFPQIRPLGIDPQDIESVITALDWVLDRIEDDDLGEIFGID